MLSLSHHPSGCQFARTSRCRSILQSFKTVAPYSPSVQRRKHVVRSSDQPPKESSNSTNAPSTSEGQQVQTQLPGEEQPLQLPRQVIERLKFTVFGFDTFWVTSVENYEADGIIFKGNIKGKDPAVSYQKMKERMQRELGDKYRLFLVEDKEEKPTAIVLPVESANEGTISKFTEVWLGALFAILTLATTINSNGAPLLQFLIDPFRTQLTAEDLLDALPGVLAFWVILGAHEWGHRAAAKRHGIDLYLPFFVPAGFGFLGGFGAITRVRGFVPNRDAMLDFALSGPLAGTVVSLSMVFLGFVLSALGAGDVAIDTPGFQDSFFMAIAAQAFLGGERMAQPLVQVNFLLLAGWAGLVVNALNLIPCGELDGGRVALGLWGRRTAGVLGVFTIASLALSSLASSLSFYWIGFVLFLQRGPILPCSEELSEPKNVGNIYRALILLALPLLVLVPFPTELVAALQNMRDPVPFY